LHAAQPTKWQQVHKGFVAQVADVIGGREAPVNEEQRAEGEKTVPGEFSKVKHIRGILSMGRYSDPDSATSSFSILLGSAPHLDEQVALLLLFLKRFCRESHELITTQNHQWQSYFWYNCIADTI
jgi:cyclophilin family peptidyl-prolyl cis-trans isomerase